MYINIINEQLSIQPWDFSLLVASEPEFLHAKVAVIRIAAWPLRTAGQVLAQCLHAAGTRPLHQWQLSYLTKGHRLQSAKSFCLTSVWQSIQQRQLCDKVSWKVPGEERFTSVLRGLRV